jgi:D-glycero-D-manno-heptose 1,7-bisphosphate phosphatase
MTVRLVLLDRDGTINRKAPEGAYVTRPEALELLPGAASAIRALNDAGLPVAVVTNQRCMALGQLDADGLEAVHAAMRARLAAAAGAHVDAIYHCPHERGTCTCRKPEPGMLAAAARSFDVPPHAVVMIGDAGSDIEAGRRFGAQTIHLTAGPSPSPLVARDLPAAVELVVAG